MMKQHIRRIVPLALVSALLLALLAGCGGEKNKVASAISQFEGACQELDVRGMIECMDPAISGPLLSAMDLFGVEDTSGALDQLVGALDLFDGAGQQTEDLVQSIRIEPKEYDFNDDRDTCTVTAELSYGDSEPRSITLQMVLEDETWYIGGIGL